MSAGAGWLGAEHAAGAAQAEPGALGGAAPAKAGTGGEDALVGSQAWKQLHIMAALAEDQSRHSSSASEDGAGAAAPVEDLRRRTSRGPQVES